MVADLSNLVAGEDLVNPRFAFRFLRNFMSGPEGPPKNTKVPPRTKPKVAKVAKQIPKVQPSRARPQLPPDRPGSPFVLGAKGFSGGKLGVARRCGGILDNIVQGTLTWDEYHAKHLSCGYILTYWTDDPNAVSRS